MARKSFIRVKARGFREIGRALKEVEAKVGKRIIKKGVTKGIQVYAKALKPAAPKETGLLRKSIGQKVKAYRNGGRVFGVAGPRTGFRRQVTVKIKNKKGRTVGKRQEIRDPNKYARITEKRRPWMRPTFHSQAQAVEQTALSTMRAECDAALKEVARTRRAA